MLLPSNIKDTQALKATRLCFRYDYAASLADRILWDNTTNAGYWVNVRIAADYCAWIENTVAANFYAVTKHCANLFAVSLDELAFVFDYYEELV